VGCKVVAATRVWALTFFPNLNAVWCYGFWVLVFYEAKAKVFV
jgi:hypothetical protein